MPLFCLGMIKVIFSIISDGLKVHSKKLGIAALTPIEMTPGKIKALKLETSLELYKVNIVEKNNSVGL